MQIDIGSVVDLPDRRRGRSSSEIFGKAVYSILGRLVPGHLFFNSISITLFSASLSLFSKSVVSNISLNVSPILEKLSTVPFFFVTF